MAEAEAKKRGWRAEWEADESYYDYPDEDAPTADEMLVCILKDMDGEVLASLAGVADPDRNYRRLVEAELAQEALS